MALSSVAGILDPYGGVRTVVARKRTFKHHAKPYEIICIVPGLLVQEPVAWEQIPKIVALAHKAVDDWVSRVGRPNDPDHVEAVTMYRLRCLECLHSKRALNLEHIVET